MDTAPLPQNQNSTVTMPQKRHSKKLVVFGVIIVLVVVGIVLYPWAKAQLEIYVLRHTFSLAHHPELALVPVSLNLPLTQATSSQSFSYYGITFGAPWTETPKIITSKDGSATQLKFPGGQFITILNGSSYTNTASGLSSTPGLDPAKLKMVYGENLASSDYDFLAAVLNSKPSDTSTAQTILSSLKYPFFGFVGANGKPIAIYSFSLPTTKGFELVGQDKTTNQEYRINFLFDAQGKGAHDFVVGNTAQDEANLVLVSIQMK